MIHDLTAEGVLGVSSDFDNTVNKEHFYELVQTGTAEDRSAKKLCEDYYGDKTTCHCCGGTIVHIPWQWDSCATLCKTCDEYLSNLYQSDLTPIESDFDFEVQKPWSFKQSNDSPLDNVLLWD